MCGIVILKGPKATKEDCEDILLKQRHRGENATSVWALGDLYIGFNRFAINDQSEGGNQPFESKNYIGVFNCEIYNSESLKEQFHLETKSGSDAEVILPLFEQVGDEVIDLLDGFYSGVIIHKNTLEIFFLRDYIGKKPLFCGEAKSFLFISSELKGISGNSSFAIVPKGVSRLEYNGAELIRHHYFEKAPSACLKDTLIDAVRKRVPKEEKQFGIFLSGGLDSSIIAWAASLISDNIVYYCLGNQDSQDAGFVRTLGKALQIEDKIKYIPLPENGEIPNLIEKIIYHTESYNPSIVSNGLATYILAKAAKDDGMKVVLSGEGADELFCGYRISKDKNAWYTNREILIANLHFTELRRVDLAAMATTIEVRCPFLDREVYRISQSLGIDSLIEDTPNLQGKMILREKFREDLPIEIIERQKMSCDVGSGIRKLVVKYSKDNPLGEKQNLQRIWSRYFPDNLKSNDYFMAYPVFDHYIDRRGESHEKKLSINFIQRLLRQHYQSTPFHTLFFLNGKEVLASHMGGTCSDKTLHFRKVLESHEIQTSLHSAFINGNECHRLLSIDLDSVRYFIDVGSGWPCMKVFPVNQEVNFTILGIQFQSFILDYGIKVQMNSGNGPKELMFIPFESKPESKILVDIDNRFAPDNVYPFNNALRFSIVKLDAFLFLKGNSLREYRDQQPYSERNISNSQIIQLIENHSPHLLPDLRIWIEKR